MAAYEALGTEFLNHVPCGQTLGCTSDHADTSPLFLHADCHPLAPLWPVYVRSESALAFRCASCDRVVAVVAVAPKTTAVMFSPADLDESRHSQ